MRAICEIIYFITAGPCLLAAVVVGLNSLRLSKRAIETTERRAMLSATAEQIKAFATSISPAFDVLQAAITEKKIGYFAKWEVHLDSSGVAAKRIAEIQNMDEFLAVLDEFLTALNPLSAWCTYFVHGLADERIAYKTLAADFLHAAELCIPSVLLLGKDRAHADLLDLYSCWRVRFERETLLEDSENLLARLADLNATGDILRRS
ncbi:MAG TPA: hypothetical protein VK581_05905 [Chthoniobacterales bacterium]|nr:hypothetical protein [Chthoniobacterales bacterium]